MSKAIKIFFLLIIVTIVFNKQLLTYYYSYKFSKWVERKFVFDEFLIDYPNSIIVYGTKIKNSNPFYYENIFESEKITLSFDVKSLLFSKLIIINNLTIESPIFFLDIIESNKDLAEGEKSSKVYDDNIGLAKKINENIPDKIWPPKKRDINFLILKAQITGAKALIKVSSFERPTETKLSDMYFNKIGNEKNYQHYKEVLKLILFDIMARTTNFELKGLLRKIYKY